MVKCYYSPIIFKSVSRNKYGSTQWLCTHRTGVFCSFPAMTRNGMQAVSPSGAAASPNSMQLRRIRCKATDTAGLKRQGSTSVFSVPMLAAVRKEPGSQKDLLAHGPFENATHQVEPAFSSEPNINRGALLSQHLWIVLLTAPRALKENSKLHEAVCAGLFPGTWQCS